MLEAEFKQADNQGVHVLEEVSMKVKTKAVRNQIYKQSNMRITTQLVIDFQEQVCRRRTKANIEQSSVVLGKINAYILMKDGLKDLIP